MSHGRHLTAAEVRDEVVRWANAAARPQSAIRPPDGIRLSARLRAWGRIRLGRDPVRVKPDQGEEYIRARFHAAPCLSLAYALLPALDPTGALWPRLADAIRLEHELRGRRIVPLPLLDLALAATASAGDDAPVLLGILDRITDPKRDRELEIWREIRTLPQTIPGALPANAVLIAAHLRTWHRNPALLPLSAPLADRVGPHRDALLRLLREADPEHPGGVLSPDAVVETPAPERADEERRGARDETGEQPRRKRAAGRPAARSPGGVEAVPRTVKFPPPEIPLPFRGDEPPIEIPEWRQLGLGTLRWDVLARSVLMVGGSGAGKTQSGILPLLRALIAAPEHARLPRPTLLVIDPKGDLIGPVSEARERAGRPLRRMLPGGDWKLDLLEHNRAGQTGASVIDLLEQVGSSRYRTTTHSGNSAYFAGTARGLLAALVELDLCLRDRGGVESVDAAWREVAGAGGSQASSDDRGEAGTLDRSLLYRPDRWMQRLPGLAGRGDVLGRLATLAEDRGLDPGVAPVLRGNADLPVETLACVAAEAARIVAPFTTPEVAAHVAVNPLEKPAGTMDLGKLLATDACLIYAPGRSGPGADLIGRALKRVAYALRRRIRPLVVVADEAHRYIDSESEVDWIDRCRAFRTCAVYATQSVSALRSAFGPEHEASVQVLLSNLGTRIFFRAADGGSQQELRELIPAAPRPEDPHVLTVRPPATLQPGEAYVVRADGEWSRGRVQRRGDDSGQHSKNGAAR